MRPIPFFAAAALGALLVHHRRARKRAERFAAAALESLLKAIDANDSQTGAHMRRVAMYSIILADAIGVREDERRTIEFTALFHDIGKIHEALFDIVHDAQKLTPAERRAIATHPQRGADVLAPIGNFYPDLAEAVLSHHERWDGSGYPRGLRGRRIPFAARVVMLADTFDAVTQTRRYRDGRSAHEAADIILAGRGTQFDAELVDLMLLPPVFQRLCKTLNNLSHRGVSCANRRDPGASKDLPKINIRWRGHSEPTSPLLKEVAASK